MNKQEEKQQNSSFGLTVITGFAIFTTLFGAGNFMLPPTLGMIAGHKSLLAAFGFVITAVILPLTGLVGSFLFDGDYKSFFARLGRIPGALLIAICMFIIGPGLVLPRIVHLCYEMLHPFLPWMSLLVFSLCFSAITFVLAYKPTRLIDILGRYITPIKLFFVGALIVLGFVNGSTIVETSISDADLLGKAMLDGYATLDLLGTIFFGSVFLSIFKKNVGSNQSYDLKKLATTGLVSSLIGASILAVVYTGMIFLGAYQGTGLIDLDPAQILSAISIRVVGVHGGLFGALALMIACLATMIALSTVIADYIKVELTGNKISFIPSLLIILTGGIIFSLLDLRQLMAYSVDVAFVLYPVLIALTLCNVGYKLFGFKAVKFPVAVVFLATLFFRFGGIELLQTRLCQPKKLPQLNAVESADERDGLSFAQSK